MRWGIYSKVMYVGNEYDRLRGRILEVKDYYFTNSIDDRMIVFFEGEDHSYAMNPDDLYCSDFNKFDSRICWSPKNRPERKI